MQKRLVLLLVSSLAMVACGTTTIEKPISTYTEPATPPADLGLALYEPRSDVADLTNAVRHVLNPADIYGGAVSELATGYRSKPARYNAVTTKVKKVSGPIVIAKLDKVHDPVYEAWRKYCDNAENMSQKDWDIIDESQMPAELEAIWADECVPLK